ncbi:hypothetical protein [Clostridium sp. OS1-26]|uniref:hypothetical protein n=1 Tax=Clostridium sp. OS1-26 TaxID=3070681 RepID=UPI0027E19AD5|nr:hypothetical protein [Clostridium sp. OS1-26]WML37270.1 hypothetical protein RCG18_12020 [Clostridium sp. OS1-26]
MSERSHIDPSKLEKVPERQPFVYKDVVSDEFPVEKHTIDGRRFKDEVEQGKYNSIVVAKDDDEHRVLYKKIK